jgi:hypothetical protein
MKNLRSKVCPWVGCGGTIVSVDHEARLAETGWVCNACGEVFGSIADYEEKLQRETSWARAWMDWSHDSQGVPETIPSKNEGLSTEAG